MLYRISRLGVGQTSKVAGLVYFALGILLIPFFYLARMAPPQPGAAPRANVSPILFLLLPFLYGLIGYVTTALMAYIYNGIAKRIGGVELDIVYAVTPPPDAASSGSGTATRDETLT